MTNAVYVAIDTNILVYAEGYNDPIREQRALDILATVPLANLILPMQVLGEFYNALVRKLGLAPKAARESCEQWSSRISTHAAESHHMAQALDLAASHNFQIWDALILSTAASAGCRMLLSEDMQHGFVWRGCTIVNPFIEPMHPLLADALRM